MIRICILECYTERNASLNILWTVNMPAPHKDVHVSADSGGLGGKGFLL